MKRLWIWIAVAVVVISPGSGLASPASPAAPLDYQLSIELDPAFNLLHGQVRIHYPASAPELSLALAQSAQIESVRLNSRQVPFAFSHGQLRLEVPDPGGPVLLEIAYQAHFSDRPPAQPQHNENPSYGVTGTILPEGTFLSPVSHWLPDPGGPVQITLDVSSPAGYEAVTEGRRVSRRLETGRSLVRWEVDRPVEELTLAAGPYQVFEDTSGAVPVYAYFSAANAPLADHYLRAARDYIDLYQELLGPYPFSKFAIVENFYPTGYGFPSWTLLGSSVIRMPFIVDTSLGHEIAHSWWGNGVLIDSREGNWAEGLTTYLADYLYKERESSAAAREYRQKILRDYTTLAAGSGIPLGRFASRFDRAFQAIGYGKCAMVFHMLRRHIGDEVFWRGIRALSRERMNRPTSWHDIEAVFSRISGRSLDNWFSQWLERADDPRLRLAGVALDRQPQGWVVRGRLEQLTTPFPLEMVVEVETTEGTVRETISTGEAVFPFSIVAAARPLSLAVDPEVDQFRLLEPYELPATVNHLRASESLTVLLADPAAERSPLMTLLAAMRKDDAKIIPARDYHPAAGADDDLLYYGYPDRLPEIEVETGIDIANGRISLPEAACDSKCDNRLLVFSRKDRPDKVVALFIAGGSREHAISVARKIPHYGKYSYLLFDADTIRDKGIWPASRSPLSHVFKEPTDP